MAADQWADIFVRFLCLSGFALLMLACIFMMIDSYVTEKSGKSSSRFEIAAKVVFALWFVNNIALFVFGIMAEWISLAKWEMWATYTVALLIGLSIWLISRQEPSKDDRNLILFSLLLLATLIIGIVSGVAMMTGRY